MNRRLYIALSKVFQYPEYRYKKDVLACYKLLEKVDKSAAVEFLPLLEYSKNHSIHSIEEVYAKTFHIQAICYLDIGYVLFGEDYRRGEFLVQMQREMLEFGIDTGCELSDNLPFVLQLLTLEDETFVKEFVSNILLPSIRLMLVEFSQSRLDFRNRVMQRKYKIVIQKEMTQQEVNLYEHVLRTLEIILKRDFGDVKPFERKIDENRLNKNFDNFMNKNSPAMTCGVLGAQNIRN